MGVENLIYNHHYFSDLVKSILEEDTNYKLYKKLEENDTYQEYVVKTSEKLLNETIEEANKNGISFIEAEDIVVLRFKESISV